MELIKVLIIDGDEASRNYLSLMLRSDNISIDLAASGKEGLINAWKERPDFIVVDPELPDITGQDLITRFRQDRRTSNTIIIALGGPFEQSVKDDLLRAGFNDYLVKSNQTLEHLIAILSGKSQPRAEENKGKLVVFLSAKGGIGTTSMCVNIASIVGRNNSDLNVALLDLVLPVGSIANIVGYTDKMNLINLVAETMDSIDPLTLKDRLSRLNNWNLFLLPGSPDPEAANNLAIGRIPAIISALRDTFDYIFVDLGTSLSRISLPIILQANVLVLMLSNDVNTLSLTNVIWKYLKGKGVMEDHLYPLLNRAIGYQGLTKPEVENMLGLQVRMSVPNMGDNLTVANNLHEPVLVKSTMESAALVLEQASRQIIEMCRKD